MRSTGSITKALAGASKVLILSFGLQLAVGCASSSPPPRVVQPVRTNTDLSSYRSFDVEVVAADAVEVSSHSLARVRDKIVQEIYEDHPGRFSASGSETDARFLRVLVEVTRYDEGNAFARSVLAGLGQIHIDAKVYIYDSDSSDLLVQYEVTKTFAWGGAYGGTTTIQDVEEGFAESVAEAVAQ